MRSRFALIFAGIAAVAAGTWYAIRTDPAKPRAGAQVSPDRQPEPAPSVRVPPTRIQPPERAPIRVPPTRIDPPDRVSPGRISDGGVTGVHAGEVHAAFEEEAREGAWAAETEGEVRSRAEVAAQAAGVRLEGVECRAARCRITIDADDDAGVGRAIARLEDSAGLDGFADALVLTNAEARSDGGRRLRVYAVFDRAP